jgi:hypothetical protein
MTFEPDKLNRDEDKEAGPIETLQEKILETREVTNSRALDGGGYTSMFVELKDDGAGVFKPANSEVAYREHAEAGTYYKRERAAYLVDKFLGFNLVPPTVIRKINNQDGSFQEFIPDAKTYSECQFSDSEEDREQIQGDTWRSEAIKLWIFDYIIYNSDRNKGNLLIKNGKISVIDNGGTFAADKLDRVVDFYNVSIPEEIKSNVAHLISNEQNQNALKTLLSELLSPGEVEAFFFRVKAIGKIMAEKGKISFDDEKELTFMEQT